MQMIGLTIATGKYLPYGLQAAETMQAHTGLLCHVCQDVPPDRHPSFHRLWIWDIVPADVEAVLYFDADTYCVRDWDPQSFAATGQFWARRDLRTVGLREECRRLGVRIGEYFNAGVFIAHRATRPTFELAQQIVSEPGFKSRYLEQTALNKAVQMHGIAVGELDARYNAICRPACFPENAIVLHRAGGGGNRRNSRWFDAQCKRLS